MNISTNLKEKKRQSCLWEPMAERKYNLIHSDWQNNNWCVCVSLVVWHSTEIFLLLFYFLVALKEKKNEKRTNIAVREASPRQVCVCANECARRKRMLSRTQMGSIHHIHCRSSFTIIQNSFQIATLLTWAFLWHFCSSLSISYLSFPQTVVIFIDQTFLSNNCPINPLEVFGFWTKTKDQVKSNKIRKRIQILNNSLSRLSSLQCPNTPIHEFGSLSFF